MVDLPCHTLYTTEYPHFSWEIERSPAAIAFFFFLPMYLFLVKKAHCFPPKKQGKLLPCFEKALAFFAFGCFFNHHTRSSYIHGLNCSSFPDDTVATRQIPLPNQMIRYVPSIMPLFHGRLPRYRQIKPRPYQLNPHPFTVTLS